MIIYIIATIWSVVFAYFSTKIQTNYTIRPQYVKKMIIEVIRFFSFFSLFFIAAFRENVGTDYDSYMLMFDHSEWFKNAGAIFMKFIEVLRKFTLDYHILFVVTSLIIYGIIFWVIFRESDIPWLSVLMFVIMEDYFVSMNAIRQYIAVVLIVLGFYFATQEKRWKMIICILIAALTHMSSMIVLPVFFLLKLKPSKNKLILSTVIASVTVFIGGNIVRKFVINYTIYGRYFESKYANETFSVAVPLLLIYITLFAVVILFCDENDILYNSKLKIYTYSIIANIIIMAVSFRLTENSYRLSYFFSVLIGIYFPHMLRSISARNTRWCVNCSAIVLFTIWTVLLITHNNQNVLPYSSVLF